MDVHNFAWWAPAARELVNLWLRFFFFLTVIIWSSLCRWAFFFFLIALIAFFNSVASENSGKRKPASVSLILTCLDSSRWLSHTSLFLPFFSLSAHTIALTLSASLTCWQQFVSRYQFSASRLRGREGCGNHLYLRLLGSVPLGMLADTCHWAAVRQKGCGMWAQATQVTVISFQKPLKLKP